MKTAEERSQRLVGEWRDGCEDDRDQDSMARELTAAMKAYAEDVIKARMPGEDEILDAAQEWFDSGKAHTNLKLVFWKGAQWIRDRLLPAKEGK